MLEANVLSLNSLMSTIGNEVKYQEIYATDKIPEANVLFLNCLLSTIGNDVKYREKYITY